jgi:hypothetical protein
MLADFLFQSEKMAINKRNFLLFIKTNKDSSKKPSLSFFTHCLIYLIISLSSLLFFPNITIFWTSIVIAVSHLLIDFSFNWVRNLADKIIKKLYNKQKIVYNQISDSPFLSCGHILEILIFIFDQFFHLILIGIFVYCFFGNDFPRYPIIAFLISPFNISNNLVVLKYILLFIILGKPANVLFKTLFGKLGPNIDENKQDVLDKCNNLTNEEKNNQPKDNKIITNKAGSIIGTLERYLILICLASGVSWGAAIIITCKGFARSKQISECNKFAEYFLIGTFYSILLTIIYFFTITKLL